jgi:hypothetical protein
MAQIFPTLRPDSISFNLGGLNVSDQETLNGGTVRFRHSHKVSNHRITLEYENLTEAQLLQIRDHYKSVSGPHYHFKVDPMIWGDSDVVPTTSFYRYAGIPEEEHFGVFNRVSVSLVVLVGLDVNYGLVGETATIGSEELVETFAFTGTAPFILFADDADPTYDAELILTAGGASS